jgi:hypothetical protein
MAAKGAIAKEQVTEAILKAFPGSFKYEKEIRIPMMENGEELQIKVTLTAAKNMVSVGGDTAMPGAFTASPAPAQLKQDAVIHEPAVPTEEEKKNVSSLLSMLGL